MTRLRTAAAAVATAALTTAATLAAPTAAHAAADDGALGPWVSTSATWGTWSLDATCHFGPTDSSSMEMRMRVQGYATAPGALRTTIRCTVESGNGTWLNVYEATSDGPVSVTHGEQYLWSAYDRVCVSATAEYGFMDTLVAPTVCRRGGT